MIGGTWRIAALQSKSIGQDEHGGDVPIWSDTAATIWVKVKPLRGRELIAAHAAYGESVVKFGFSNIAGLTITSGMRIVYNGKYYDIIEVLDINEKHLEIEVLARTGASKG